MELSQNEIVNRIRATFSDTSYDTILNQSIATGRTYIGIILDGEAKFFIQVDTEDSACL